jgi:predicted HTH domain antitoxin
MVLYIEIPDVLPNMRHYSKQDLLLDVAIILYLRGIWKLDAAAHFAGVDHTFFKDLLKKRSLPQEDELQIDETPIPSEAPLLDAPKGTLHPILRPIRPKLILENLIQEQAYKGMDTARVNKAIEAMQIEEPIELLLSQLSR